MADERTLDPVEDRSRRPRRQACRCSTRPCLLVRSGMVLLCRRRADRTWYPDCWGLPGGHIEAVETVRDALDRECGEDRSLLIQVLDAGGVEKPATADRPADFR